MKPKKQSAKSSGDGAQPGSAASRPPSEPPSSPRARRLRWFRLFALLLSLSALVLFELLLRAFGYGYSTGFFRTSRVNGQPVYVENQQFSRRYFPPGLERTPQPVMFAATKPADTIRIFVFGESAAMGDPEPAYGFPRILEVLLREAMRGKKIEVINVAVTAINSHVIREIAKDCVDKQGDYWIVYMGNNEVVGPFGAGTIFGHQVPGLGLIRAQLAVKSTRLGQLLDALRHRLGRRPSGPAEWGGMEMFLNQQVAQDDPRMAKVYAHFESNLRDIIRLGEKSGAKVLIGTVASNLKDCPPFASGHRAGLSVEQKAEWDRLLQAGITQESRTNFAEAVAAYEQAVKLDDRQAEVQFRLGRCRWELGRFAEAKDNFERARDLDTLRFRADTRINEIITAAGSEKAGPALVDTAGLILRNSPHGIAGDEFFYEHVHFNFAGNYRIARAFAEQVLAGGNSGSGLLPELACARRLGLTDFDRYRVLDEVRQRLRQPPFSNQSGHEERDRRVGEQLKRLDRASFTNAVGVYEQAIAQAPEDWVLRENFATLLQDFGQARDAEAQWRRMTELLPHSEQAWYGLGNALDADGQSAEAIFAFRKALQRRPDSAEARNGLALALAGQGKLAEAINEFAQILRQKPDFVEARVNLGQTLAQQGRHAEATAQYLEVLRRQSNNVPARINLGKLFAVQGKHAEAAAQYREALRLKPDNAIAHYNLGNALNALGDGAAAGQSFAEAVRCNPSFPEARYNLALALARENRNAEVIEHLSELVRLKPAWADARFNLGVALAKAQRFDEAIGQFKETLRLDPANAAATKFLDQAEARRRTQ